MAPEKCVFSDEKVRFLCELLRNLTLRFLILRQIAFFVEFLRNITLRFLFLRNLTFAFFI
jgi:hypothetical protein